MEKEEKKEEEKIEVGTDFSQYLVKPHKIISKKVTEEDIERLIEDAHTMYNICNSKVGIYKGFLAIAHPQITDEKPLRFFVTREKEIIVNPEITRHTETTIDSEEGCATFPNKIPVIVQRHNKCEVRYQTLTNDSKLSEFKEESLSSLRSKMFQHEIDHLDATYIFKVE